MLSSNNDRSPEVFEHRWSAYYDAVVGRSPRDTLLTALANFELESFENSTTHTRASQFAVDLGCGEGRDTVELLRRGWRVLAVDGQAEAITRLLNRPDINHQLLETLISRFEYVTLPESVDMVNASFSLPFCSPEHFPQLWDKITSSLRSRGRFCGQLFGDRDSWAVFPTISYHTRLQVEALLQPFEIEILDEEEHPGKTALGEDKYWHLFQIVARKK
ncbi:MULTISPECIES: class I SAM-dependent methyltransferase [Nostocales]|uniref:Class I SAM-dependent methyltransferase n=3 Tax=Nostocales TaxID=1161 RepID=A0A0C1NJ89_9CYAN|nr:class I SAM-dependent methyltransferase [Tolypothrix bouteillei]KAF3888192.1 class I SAM-dependent methyltransferase [Tolypothrix bouteillei VB521301]